MREHSRHRGIHVPLASTRVGLAAALAAVLLAAGGCEQPVSPEARQLVTDSRAAYQRGDDAAVIRDTTAFLDGHANSKLADVAYYLRGLARCRQNDLAGAKSDLKAAAATAQRKDVRVGALKALGDLAFDEDDMNWAEDLFRQALAEAEPKKQPIDEIRYRLGCVLQRKGRWSEADEQFDRVAHVFAGTEAARRAERRLRCLAWTVQAGAFAGKKLADADAARLRAKKLSAVVRPVTAGGRLQFVVQVGWYDSYERAAAALPSVRRHRGDAFITPTR